MRLAEQHKRLTEENPSRRVKSKFDREHPTPNSGSGTRIANQWGLFMLLNSQYSECKEKSIAKIFFEFLPFARLCDDRPLQPSTVSYRCRDTESAATFSRRCRATLTYCTSARSAAVTQEATAAIKLRSKP